MPTHGEMIDEISREPPEPFAKERLIDAIVERCGRARPINIQSLGIDIADCCVNLKSNSRARSLIEYLVDLNKGLTINYPKNLEIISSKIITHT